jgi:hypothetical protein
MYADLPQRLRELIDELVELEVRIRELENRNGDFARRALYIQRIAICNDACDYCKAHNLNNRVVNAAFFERLGKQVTDDSIV